MSGIMQSKFVYLSKGQDMSMENKAEIKPTVGSVVRSKAGRDSGRCFVVMWTEENFVGLCDGDLHKTDKIKKKKIKHVIPTEYVSAFVVAKLDAGDKVTNSEIRRELAEYQAEYGEAVE